MTLQRIIIIGVTGSGKTTLGKKLSEELGIPTIDLDDIHWLPGWQEREIGEARALIDAATQKPAWVLSGNYSKFQDIFWARADTLVCLDYPFFLVFWRLLRRSLCRMVDRKLICNGNYETWENFFSKKSIMLWFFQSFGKRRRKAAEIFSHLGQHPHLTLIRLKSPRETEVWLKSISGA